MMVASSSLPDTLQSLIDARLDTIDRMLVGRVNRQDRLAIVREVETQVYELLGERDAASLDRDDVLAVLSRLDPPEAYLPDEATDGANATRPRGGFAPQAAPKPRPDRMARSSGILGLCSLLMLVFTSILSSFGYGSNIFSVEIPIFCCTFLTVVMGAVTITLSAVARVRGLWGIMGLVTGVLTTFGIFFEAFLFMMG